MFDNHIFLVIYRTSMSWYYARRQSQKIENR